MILPGRALLTRRILTHVHSPHIQAQPCGVDLTLKRILSWDSPGTLDFDNTRREAAGTGAVAASYSKDSSLLLQAGAYTVEFNEQVDMPLDAMGQIFARSTLWRSGANVSAGVVDSGYAGVLGAQLHVWNTHGLRLYPLARLAQLVCHGMEGEVAGYGGMYQGKASL